MITSSPTDFTAHITRTRRVLEAAPGVHTLSERMLAISTLGELLRESDETATAVLLRYATADSNHAVRVLRVLDCIAISADTWFS